MSSAELKCSTYCDPEANRTPNPQLRRNEVIEKPSDIQQIITKIYSYKDEVLALVLAARVLQLTQA
jgi:hypothetical protein